MKMACRCLVALTALHLGLVGAAKLRAGGIKPQLPPEPVGEMPTAQADGAFASKTEACNACKYKATGSCAMYKTCLCHASNTFFKSPGIAEPTDKNNWRWACGSEGGDKYQMCFKSTEVQAGQTYLDNFGDPVDVNNPKCPV